MGILSRMYTITRATINSLLNKAEDPKKILEQTILDLDEAYKKAREQVAQSMADQKRIEKSIKDEEAEISKWSRRAAQAVQKGDDSLAREALHRRSEHEHRLNQYQQNQEQQATNVARLKEGLAELESKISELKRNKNLLISKQRQAEAQQKISGTLGNMNAGGSLETVKRMEEKIDEMVNIGHAQSELNAEFSGDALENKFSKLDGGDDKVENELLALKDQLKLDKPKTDS